MSKNECKYELFNPFKLRLYILSFFLLITSCSPVNGNEKDGQGNGGIIVTDVCQIGTEKEPIGLMTQKDIIIACKDVLIFQTSEYEDSQLIKIRIKIDSQHRLKFLPDIPFVISPIDGAYIIHAEYLPNSEQQILVAVYDADGKLVGVFVLGIDQATEPPAIPTSIPSA